MQEVKPNVVKAIESSVKTNKDLKGKKKYLVVLACPKYTIYIDENDNYVEIRGNHNVKKGDYIII